MQPVGALVTRFGILVEPGRGEGQATPLRHGQAGVGHGEITDQLDEFVLTLGEQRLHPLPGLQQEPDLGRADEALLIGRRHVGARPQAPRPVHEPGGGLGGDLGPGCDPRSGGAGAVSGEDGPGLEHRRQPGERRVDLARQLHQRQQPVGQFAIGEPAGFRAQQLDQQSPIFATPRISPQPSLRVIHDAVHGAHITRTPVR